MKPKKLKYDEITDTFAVYSGAVEGAQRQMVASATEEWVIKAIINQNVINNDSDELTLRMETLFNKNFTEVNYKIDQTFRDMRVQFIEKMDELKPKLEPKKKWWKWK